ncbi:MAG: hypothetical protein JST32_16085 [Bacteroidetes bacterium]|nr:hypothetical protein [Bacteroidota bacterium]
MLSKVGLIDEISKTMVKTKVGKLTAILDKQHFALRDLVDVTFHEDKNIAFRAAWILENFFLKKPGAYSDDLEYLVSRVKDVTWPSCQRHYAKIMMHITAKKAPPIIREKLETMDLEPIVEKLFDWVIDPKVLIAVKVFSLEALFNLRGQYTWITDELKEQTKFLMRDGTPAIQSRGRKLLSKL